MSAVNLFLTSRAAHFFTDGAAYNRDTAKIEGFIPKVVLLPHLQCAFAVVGSPQSRIMCEAGFAETEATNFDALVDTFDELLHTFYKHKIADQALMDCGMFFLAIAGWSRKFSGPLAFGLTGASDIPGLQPFKKRRIDSIVNMPNDEIIAGFDFDESSVEKSGLKFLNYQRSKPWAPHGTGSQFYIVGGFAQHTVITETEVSTSCIHRWPDKIGSVIDPSKAE